MAVVAVMVPARTGVQARGGQVHYLTDGDLPACGSRVRCGVGSSVRRRAYAASIRPADEQPASCQKCIGLDDG